MVITDHITGQTVENPPGATAQVVVDLLVQQLGLPKRSENGDPVTYRLTAGGIPLAPSEPVTGDAHLESDTAGEVYARVTATLEEIEADLQTDDAPVHLSTRLSIARRTGAAPERLTQVENAFQAKAFAPLAVPAKPFGIRTRLVPIVGGLLLVGFFVWLFWYTEPNAPDVVAAQESDAEVTVLNTSSEVEGRIDVNREIDLYTFSAVDGDFVTVAMIATGNQEFQGFDAELSVDDPDGSQVAYNDDFNGLNSQVSFDVFEPGEYTIRARSLGGCCVGDYLLVFEISN